MMKNYFLVAALVANLLCAAQEEPEDMKISQRYDLHEIAIEGKVRLKPGDLIALNDLNFSAGTTTLLPTSEPVLQDLLKIMQDNPKLVIQVQGHICCIPDEGHEISNARARVVMRYLKKNGIDKDRVSHKDFGGTCPLYPIPEATDEERVANRRVEIEIVAN